jgi:uncharacterized BrkB/YihY/UPF0761 family membrane protein
VIGGAGSNPLLAGFALIVGLLIWFNLVARIYLLAVAWIAIGMDDAGIAAIDTSLVKKAKRTSPPSAHKKDPPE